MNLNRSDRGRLLAVLGLITAFFVLELSASFYANSLALFSDAIHLLTDMGAIVLSLFALWVTSRPAQAGKTYGYLRAEILGALLNGLFLWVLVAFVAFEAVRRFHHPAAVNGLPVIAVACVGLVVNSVATWVTYQSDSGHAGMAVRAVFLHALSDLMGSLGVLLSGVIIYFTGWRMADPLVSLFLCLLILYSSVGLLKEGVDILMEAVPAHLDLNQIRAGLLAVEGTREVHDLHVWALTTRELALSAHAVISERVDPDRVLADMSLVLAGFNIHHMTVQLERDNRRAREPQHF